jgi:hypothetical protein
VAAGGAVLAGAECKTCEVEVEVGGVAVVVGRLVVLEGGSDGGMVVVVNFVLCEPVGLVRAVL